MHVLAEMVDEDCDWVTVGYEYSAVSENRDFVTILDDTGLKTIVFRPRLSILNEYVKWVFIY